MIKIFKTFVAASIAMSGVVLFSACGEDAGSGIDYSVANEYKKLPKCALNNDAEKVTIEGSDVIYVCRDEIWEVLDTTFVAKDTAQTLEKIPNCADAQEGKSFYIQNTGVSYICKDERWEIAIIPTEQSSSSRKVASSSSTAESDDDKGSGSAKSSDSKDGVESSSSPESSGESLKSSASVESSASAKSSDSTAKSSSSTKSSASVNSSSSEAATIKSSSSSKGESGSGESDEKIAATKDDLPNCTAENEGEIFYVENDDRSYQCSSKRTWDAIYMCGEKSYNSEEQFCDGDKIYNRADYCYFTTTKTWNVKYPVADYFCLGTGIKSRSEFGECGNGYYALDSKFCSDGVAYPLCGDDGEYDDPANAICFENEVYRKSEYAECKDDDGIVVDVYKVAYQFCGKSGSEYDVYSQAGFCVTTEAGTWDANYSKSAYFCNDGEPLAKKEYAECGDGYYNKSEQLCYKGETYSQTEKAVCDDVLYDVKYNGVCVKNSSTGKYQYGTMPVYVYLITKYVDLTSYSEQTSSGETKREWSGSRTYADADGAVQAYENLDSDLQNGWGSDTKYGVSSTNGNIKTADKVVRKYDMEMDAAGINVIYTVTSTVEKSSKTLTVKAEMVR